MSCVAPIKDADFAIHTMAPFMVLATYEYHWKGQISVQGSVASYKYAN